MILPRLGIGTVQFGLDYGIANDTGQVAYPDVVRILERSLEAGATLLDTARAYGTSEQTIGRALKELGAENRFTVCTKLDLPPGTEELDDAAVVSAVHRGIEMSKEALGLQQLPVYLLHKPTDAGFRDGLIWNTLVEHLSSGTLGVLGVSLPGKDPRTEMTCLAAPEIGIVQIPYNVLDHRWEDLELFDRARGRSISIISRSSYLKGLLAMPRERIPWFLSDAHPFLDRVAATARDLGIESRELALRYVLATTDISCTIVGIDSMDQLEDNIRVWSEKPLDKATMGRLRADTRGVPELVIVPALWEQYIGREDYGGGK